MHQLYTLIPLSRSCSSVWLERLPVTQEVAGSNPVSSAKKLKGTAMQCLFIFPPPHLQEAILYLGTNSTRRFFSRPASAVLGATGAR